MKLYLGTSISYRFYLIPFLLATMGCEDILTEKRYLELEYFGDGDRGAYWEGYAAPFSVKLINGDGLAVPEVEVTFEVTGGTNDIQNLQSVTDDDGLASGTLVLSRGYNSITADAPGAKKIDFMVYADPPVKVRLDYDSLFLERVGSSEFIFAGVYEGNELLLGSNVEFRAANPDIVRFMGTNDTGNYRGMSAEVVALAVGETLIIAEHLSGAADTAYVRVSEDLNAFIQWNHR